MANNWVEKIVNFVNSGGFSSGSSKTPASQSGGSSGNAAPSASKGSAKATSYAYTGKSTSNTTAKKTTPSFTTGGSSDSNSSNGRTANSSALENYDVKSAVEKAGDIVDSLGSGSKNKLVGYDMLEWQADEAQSKAKNAEKNYYDALEKSGYDAGDAKVKSAKQMLDDALREAKIYSAASKNAPQLVSDRTSERVVDTAKGGAMDWAASIVNMAGAAYEGGARGAESQNETEVADLQQRLANAQEMYDNAVVKYNGDTENPNVKAAQATIDDIQRDINVRQNIDYGKLEPISQGIYSKADDLSAKAAENIASAKEGLGKGGQLAVDVGVAGTQLLLDAASGRLVGGGTVPLLARSFGGGALEARNAGADYQEQALYGIANAVVEAGTEKLFDGLAGIYGKGIVKSGSKTEVKNAVLQKLTQTEAGQKALSILKGMGGEAAEEVIADVLNPAIQAIYNGQSIGQNYSELEAADVVYDAIIGAVLGGAGSVASAASTQGVQSTQNAQNTTETASNEITPAVTQGTGNGTFDEFNSRIADEQKETVPNRTDSTSVNDNPATHTAEELARIEEYKSAVDENLLQYVENVKNNPGAKLGRFTFKPVNERAAAEIKALTNVDVTGNKTQLEARIVEHILKDHGAEGKTDHSMKDVNDIARIQYVLDNFDNVDYGGKSAAYQTVKPNGKPGQAQTVVFTKAINGTYYVVEAVPDTKAKTVFIVSAYISNKKTGDMQTATAEAMRNTSETKNAQSPDIAEGFPSNKSIPAQTSVVNGNNSGQNTVPPTTAESTMGAGPMRERGGSVGIRTNESNEPLLRESFEANPEYYTQLTNAEVVEKANAILAKGFETARSEVEQALGAAKAGMKLAPEYVVAAQEVANVLARQGKEAAAHEIEADVIAELTAAGQLGQIGRLIRASAASVERGIQKALDKVTQEAARKGFDWKAELTEAEKTLIRNTDFKQPGAYEEVYTQIAERVGREMPSTVWEKLQEVRKMNMLLRPRTIIKNVASNVPMMGVRKLSEGMSAAIQTELVKRGKMDAADQTRAKASDTDRQVASEFWEMHSGDILRQGNKWDINSELRDQRTVFKGGAIDKALFKGSAIEKVASKLTGKEYDSFLEAARQVTYAMLEKGDVPFVKSAFVDSLAQYCAAQGITDANKVPQAAIDFATANAMEATFKKANTLAKALNKMKSESSPAVAAAIDIILPFTTTPANIMSLMGEYSPLGFAKLISKDGPAAKIDAFSKASVGSAIMLMGYLLRSAGMITGGEDEDKDKAALDRATGVGSYSIGGKVSYDWAQPVGSLLALGAEISDAISGQESWDSAIMNAIYTAGDAVLNMSMFQNILSVLKGSGKPTQQIIDAIMEGGASQLIPGLAGDIAKIIDGTVRSTYTGGNVFNDITAKTIANIPGLSTTLPESVNVKGEANTRGSLPERLLNTLINPTNITRGNRNAQDEEIYRLYEQTGSKTHFPEVSPYKVEYASKNYALNGEERAQFQKTQGDTYYNYVAAAMESPFYQALSDKQKQEVLTQFGSYALDAAKKQLVESRGDKFDSSMSENAVTLNIPAYLAAKTAYSAAADAENKNPDYASLDGILANLSNMDKATRDKLDGESGFKNLRFAHDVYGMDAEQAIGIRKLVDAEQDADLKGKNSAASDAAVIAKSFKGSDSEKIAALETMNLPYADTGKRASIVRRFEAAQAEGMPFDEWSKIESYIDATKTSDTPNKATIVAAGEKFGYSGSQVYSIYKKYPYDEEIVDITNDYFSKDYVEPEGVDLYYYLTGEKAPDAADAEGSPSGGGYSGSRYYGGRSSGSTKSANLGDSVAAVKSIANKSTSTGNTDYLNRVLRDVIAANNRQAEAKPAVNWETLLAQYIKPIK